MHDDAQAAWLRKQNRPNANLPMPSVRPVMARKRSTSLPSSVEYTALQFAGYPALHIPNTYNSGAGGPQHAPASRILSSSRPAASVLQNTQPIHPAFPGGPLETLAPQRTPSFMDTPSDRPKVPSHPLRPSNKRLASRTLGPEEAKRQSTGGDLLLFESGWNATGRRNSAPSIPSPYLDNGGGSWFGDEWQVGYPFPSPMVPSTAEAG
jgi:hypothetical protein